MYSPLKLSVEAAGRAGTRQLRYDVNNLINNAASDMSVHWNKTNRAFTDRISECQDAHRNLKSNLILTKNVSTFHTVLSLFGISICQSVYSKLIEDVFDLTGLKLNTSSILRLWSF